MLSRWTIQNKLLFGVAILWLMMATLAFSGFRGVYSYRGLARGISQRATELPRAAKLTQAVADLRLPLEHLSPLPGFGLDADPATVRDQLRIRIQFVENSLHQYSKQLDRVDEGDPRITDKSRERKTVIELEQALAEFGEQLETHRWHVSLDDLRSRHDRLNRLAGELPGHLQANLEAFSLDVRSQYRTWIVLTWVTSAAAVILLTLLVKFFYDSIFRPLRVLVDGSRRVAAGDFQHRIQLQTRDEVAELAEAMNAMTVRFQEIRDDLDRQVQERTREVVRSEQLASVGFLAAGVAHEINNPLASIAWCAESLESRLHEQLHDDPYGHPRGAQLRRNDSEHGGAGREDSDENHSGPANPVQAAETALLRKYLRRIQDEAFRCKGITERLLDFSRLGDKERAPTDLADLVQGVIEMVQHVGRYREKQITFRRDAVVIAAVNTQEMKQVVLNLITNALDSLDPGGQVIVRVGKRDGEAELIVHDNGCGMTEEVRRHLFEPFFTRRRDGQGTGLGLSISYRIIIDHGGSVTARSAGPGLGSEFRVLLPSIEQAPIHETHQQAA